MSQVTIVTVEDKSPEARMARRYPQKVQVGVLKHYLFTEFDRREVGDIVQVSRTMLGKIQLIVLLSRRFGWIRRLIAVPIELVGIRGTEVVALDINLDMVRATSTWTPAAAQILGDDETILIALAKS